MHPGPNTRKSTANQPWWQCGHHLVGTMWSIKKTTTHDLQLSKKPFSNKKKGPRSAGSLLLIFLKKKKQPRPAFQKNLLQKNVNRPLLSKKTFSNNTKGPHPPATAHSQVNCFFCTRKKTDQGFLKKFFFKPKNVDGSFQKNLFPTKRKVPTRRSAMTATARSAA